MKVSFNILVASHAPTRQSVRHLTFRFFAFALFCAAQFLCYQNARAQQVGAMAQATRERRAEAYAKMLEGERLLFAASRRNSSPDASQQARAAFQQAAELDPKLAEAHTALADISFFFLRDADAAEREARLAAQIDRDNFGAHRWLSRIYALKSGLNEGKVSREAADRAIAELREVVRLRPNDAEAWALMGELYDATGRRDEAIAAFTRWASAPQPTDGRFFQAVVRGERLTPAAAAARLASALQKAGRSAEALNAAQRAVAIEPENEEYTNQLANVTLQNILALREAGKRQEAFDAAHAARERFPQAEVFARLEAMTLAEIGRVDDAAALIRSRIKGKPEDYNEYLTLATVYMDADRGADAVIAARKALELAPEDQAELVTQALLVLSSAQERANDFKGAEDSLRHVLAKDPANPTALNNLGYFLTERGERLPEALQMIERAVKSEPTNASFLDSLGWAHFKLGQLDEAERFLSDAAAHNPSSATIQEHLGDTLKARGKTDAARAAWRKALSLTNKPQVVARLKRKLEEK